MSLIVRAATLGLYGGPKREPKLKLQEIQRTCSRCGHVWYITPAEAKMRAPNSLSVAGQKMTIAGNRGKVIGGKKKAIAGELKLQRMLSQQDRVVQIGRCSECGSVSFTEEPIRA